MATFLTTTKMDAALAARIEASVSGKNPRQRARARKPRLVALARLGLVVFVVVVVYSLVSGRRAAQRDVSRARVELLDVVERHAASLTDTEKTWAVRAETWLVKDSRAFEGELVAGELRAKGALEATLARPIVYVRGSVAGFATPKGVGELAASSTKDAFVLCLLEPPTSRAEKDLLPKVRVAYGRGAAMEERTSNVRRLHEAEVGLAFLAPTWIARVASAPDLGELAKLKRDFERAPIEAAKKAARSTLLLAVMDEPGEAGGPTELDGERTHYVRVVLVDLAKSEVLLRTRKLVDPSFISLAKKSDFATGLDSCALALDIHASTKK